MCAWLRGEGVVGMNRGEVPRRRKGRASLGMTTKTEAGATGTATATRFARLGGRRCAPIFTRPLRAGLNCAAPAALVFFAGEDVRVASRWRSGEDESRRGPSSAQRARLARDDNENRSGGQRRLQRQL